MKRKQTPTGPTTTYRFGFRFSDIQQAAKVIRPLLKIRWRLLDEAFWGGKHYLQIYKSGVLIKLHHNYEPHFDHWLQPAYRDYPILLLMQYPPGEKIPNPDDLLARFSAVVETVFIPPNQDAWEEQTFQASQE